MAVSHLRLALISSYMRSSFSFGSAAIVSAAAPRVGISAGGRNFTASPGSQAGLPPGPWVASGTDLSNLPPVSPLALTDCPIEQPVVEMTVAVAPADPINFSRVRRSIRDVVVAIRCPSRLPRPARGGFRGLLFVHAGALENPFHPDVALVARVLVNRFGAARHWYLRRPRSDPGRRILDGELIEQRVRAVELEPLGQLHL